ncbi:MAG TPA: hypothetical protein VN888_20995, partial [Mycobacterium sp.]|nr:hypothetical protein [Mycobacterium sp.]
CLRVHPANAGQRPADDPSRAEHLSTAGLAKYKWPEELRCHLDDFPRTAAGKVRKTELRAAWRGDSRD